MKISIVGACCHDEIVTLDGTVRHSFGGILYNTNAFSSLLGPNDIVRPCTNLGEDRYDAAMAEFDRFPNLDPSGLVKVPGRMTDVRLVYTAPTCRDECIRFMMKPITVDDLSDALDSDAITFNFINGSEVSVETIAALRSRYNGFMAMDIHNLVILFDEQGKMHYRGLPNWRDWLANLNLVQMNEVECARVLNREFPEDIQAYREAAEELATALQPQVSSEIPRIAIVTLAARGSVMAYYRDGQLLSKWCHARAVEKMVDPTGCGDSFLAAFVITYLRTKNPLLSNAAANIVAAATCEHSGLVSLSHLRNAADLVSQVYPDWNVE